MLCLTCKRVRPARSPEEYTVLRAYSITMYGLCTCAQPGAWLPDTAVTGSTDTAVTGSTDTAVTGSTDTAVTGSTDTTVTGSTGTGSTGTREAGS